MGVAGMASSQRLHRTVPDRDRPHRAVRSDAASPAARGQPAPTTTIHNPSSDAAPSVVTRAVETAYRIVGDNVQEGRLAAERLHAAARPPEQEPPSAKAVANRLMHMYRELAITSGDLVAALLRESDARALVDQISGHNRHAPGHGAGVAAGAVSITQRVRSRKPVEVTLSSLSALRPGMALAVAGLHALTPASTPISGIVLVVGADGRLEVDITVPDDQAADVYCGTVVDVCSRQPLGSLTVRVIE